MVERDERPGRPFRPANKRSAARLAAVQAIYQMDVGGASVPAVVAEFEAHRLGGEIEGEQLLPADAAFFRVLAGGVVEQQRVIDPVIHKALPADWPLSRLDTTLRAILRCGAFELMERRDVPARAAISEYIDISRAFFFGEEPKLVNGVLDRIAHDWRPEEFGEKAGDVGRDA